MDAKEATAEAVAVQQPQDRRQSRVPAIMLPKGGAIRGIGEKFAANPVTGTGLMTVSSATSPARGGFGSQRALSYESKCQNSAFGFGWGLNLPTLTRKIDKDLPLYYDSAESDVFPPPGAEDLVPVPQENGKLDDLITAPGYTIRRYRRRIEGLFTQALETLELTLNRRSLRGFASDAQLGG